MCIRDRSGDYVYLCYSTNPSLGDPITGIQVFAGGSDNFQIQSGYTKIEKDLNSGASGSYIYICYTKNAGSAPISEVDVIQGGDRYVYPQENAVRIDQDCSEGAGRDYTYVVYKI